MDLARGSKDRLPADQVVARALREALRARGVLAEGAGARRRLAVDNTQFNAYQYVRREATVASRLTLLDAETGRQLWADSARVYQVDGHLFTADGVFGSVEELRPDDARPPPGSRHAYCYETKVSLRSVRQRNALVGHRCAHGPRRSHRCTADRRATQPVILSSHGGSHGDQGQRNR